MFLIYVDENGISKKHPDKLFCLGAVVVHEQIWASTNAAVVDLKMRHFQSASVEIHTANIYKQKGEFLHLNEPHSLSILNDVYDLIAHSNVTLFSVLVDKTVLASPDQDAELLAWELLLERLQLAMSTFCKTKQTDEYAMIIMDAKNPARDEIIRNYIKYCQLYGTRFQKNIDRIIDEPNFTPSKWRNLTQLADAATYCFKNQFIQQPFFTKQFEKIRPRYHHDGNGKVEGYGIKIYR